MVTEYNRNTIIRRRMEAEAKAKANVQSAEEKAPAVTEAEKPKKTDAEKLKKKKD